MYKFLRVFLFKLDPELAHFWGLLVVKVLGMLHRKGLWARPAWATLPNLQTSTPFGPVDSPLGLAAGLDKNAEALWGWQALGFGFVEVGTVTPLFQNGNEKPRLFRLPVIRALVNRMGFNSLGPMEVADRIRLAKSQGIKIRIGGNIGKNASTPLAQAHEDYKKAAMLLHPHVDYLVINVSSPNTPGLRDLQLEVHMEKIVEAVRRETPDKPLFIKVAPDNGAQFMPGILNVVRKYKLQGIICGNTLANHASCDELTEFQVITLPAGGLSGAPLLKKNLKLAEDYLLNQPQPFVIGVGGIMNGEAAKDYLHLGCPLIQIYTGLVYEGPALIRDILKTLARG